jgi:hypothetical protein
LGALLAGSLLSACVQKEPDPVGPGGNAGEVGKAEIMLPALPPGFLLKAASSGAAADPFFILTISGPGMVARKHAWPLSSAGGTAVTVENIPVGSRLFTGEIEAGGGIVYADSAWTAIEAGRTALVRLRLGRTTGNAKVCVEIEGLPPPTGCGRDSLPNPLPPLPLPIDSSLTCFDVVQILDRVEAKGRFVVLQQGNELFGHFQWLGYPGMPMSGKAAPVNGNLGLYLYGNLPTGLARDPLFSDGVHYKAQVTGQGMLQSGTIYGTNGEYVLRGEWKGSQSACRTGEREIIRSVYGL